MQLNPLLEKLDWFFTLASRTLSHPNTMDYPLAMTTSDHVPCIIQIKNSLRKSNLFRFENSWMEHLQCLPLVESIWTHNIHYPDAPKRINAKMKILRKNLNTWAKTLSIVKVDVADINDLVSMLDSVENSRNLSPLESSLTISLKDHMTNLLQQQKIYWQQRGKIKWVIGQ